MRSRFWRDLLRGSSQDETALMVGLFEFLCDLLPSGKIMGGAPANFAYMANALGDWV